jgi:hypothetical protein
VQIAGSAQVGRHGPIAKGDILAKSPGVSRTSLSKDLGTLCGPVLAPMVDYHSGRGDEVPLFSHGGAMPDLRAEAFRLTQFARCAG